MTHQLGKDYEAVASRFLAKNGCRLVVNNYHTRHGEIDIIVIDGDTLVFVEVKQRQSSEFGGALGAITSRKQQRLIKTAQCYLLQYPCYDKMPCRFDVIAIHGSDRRCEWLKGAFSL